MVVKLGAPAHPDCPWLPENLLSRNSWALSSSSLPDALLFCSQSVRQGHGLHQKGARVAEGGAPWMREGDLPPGTEVGARGNAVGQGGKKRWYSIRTDGFLCTAKSNGTRL